MDYAQPTAIDEALHLLADGEWTILAGGTDYYPALGNRAANTNLLDISRVKDLRGIVEKSSCWSIGALTTWSDLIDADLPPAFDALKLAGREVGSVQIQNRGSIAGNICNASPAADGVPPLLCLDAQVRLLSATGARDIPLSEFLTGNRATALGAGEMVSEILIAKSACVGNSRFLKLGARKYLVISISVVAARIAKDAKNTITDAAVSVGACSVVANRLPELEAALVGQPATATVTAIVDGRHFVGLSPIDDVRATAGYRVKAAVELVRRVLREAAA